MPLPKRWLLALSRETKTPILRSIKASSRSIQTFHVPFNHKPLCPVLQPSRPLLSKGVYPESSKRRVVLVLLPFILGGSYLYADQKRKKPPLHEVIALSSFIPTNEDPLLPLPPLASSPLEPSISNIITDFLRRRVIEPIRTSLRLLHLIWIFAPVVIAVPLLLLGTTEDDNTGRWGALVWYDFLVSRMQKAGPTFIKLAQWAGSRRDLFSTELCERFGTLHSTTEPHPLSHTIRIVEEVFNKPFSEVFETFEPNALGSGAIAQVYRAKLRPNLLPPSYLSAKRKAQIMTPLDPSPALSLVPSAYVAVKVLHPKVEDTIRRDLSIMKFFAKALSMVPSLSWLSLDQEVEVFGSMMYGQLDLRHEARNLKRFEENFRTRRAAISFPRPLEDYSTDKLLLEEFEDAVPMTAFLSNGGGRYEQQIATAGLDAFLNMLLLDNFVHADLHPGNILIKFYKPSTRFVLQSIAANLFNTAQPIDPVNEKEAEATIKLLQYLRKGKQEEWLAALDAMHKQGYQPELVFLDAGLVTTLGETDRRNFLDLFRAIATFDGYTAGKLMVERCRAPELALEPETFALKMQHLVLSVKAKTFSLGRIRIADILSEVLRMVREHHVKMEGDFVNTVISVLLLEGIGRQLDPGMDLFKSALPILRQLARQVSAKEAIAELPGGNFGTMFKFWVWLEARELISSALLNVDSLIEQDWLTPNI